jgi:hypothetical protein
MLIADESDKRVSYAGRHAIIRDIHPSEAAGFVNCFPNLKRFKASLYLDYTECPIHDYIKKNKPSVHIVGIEKTDCCENFFFSLRNMY